MFKALAPIVIFLLPFVDFIPVHAKDMGEVLGKTKSQELRPVKSDVELRPHVGMKIGLADPEGPQSGTANFIIDVGFQPYVPFSVGMELSNENLDDSRVGLMAKSSYNFAGSGLLGYSYVGAAAGIVWLKANAYGGLTPLLGFDYPLATVEAGFVSLGAEARYAMVAGDSPDSLSLNGAVKYWF